MKTITNIASSPWTTIVLCALLIGALIGVRL